MASDRSHGSGKEPNEEEKMLRLFIMVPRDFNEEDVEQEFKVWVLI